jgi:low affinity Fe/Cu permease
MKSKTKGLTIWFEKFANRITILSGKPLTFILACTSITIWAITGPLFNYSNTWQLVINTGTTIITFLMVFLIQQSQNKDSLAIQLKLNEIVASIDGASNRLINVQDLSESDLLILHQFYDRLSKMSKKEEKLNLSHSIDEAAERHKSKMKITHWNSIPPSLKSFHQKKWRAKTKKYKRMI